MKSTMHYQYKGTTAFTVEDLFNKFCIDKSTNFYFESSKKRIERKVFDYKPISITNTNIKRFLKIEAHFRGSFSYLLNPLNIPRSEQIDADLPSWCVLSVREDGTCMSGGINPDDLSNLETNREYEKLENIELSEASIREGLKEYIPSLSDMYSEISRSGQRIEGDFTITNIVVVDFPVITVTFNYISRNIILELWNPWSKGLTKSIIAEECDGDASMYKRNLNTFISMISPANNGVFELETPAEPSTDNGFGNKVKDSLKGLLSKFNK